MTPIHRPSCPDFLLPYLNLSESPRSSMSQDLYKSLSRERGGLPMVLERNKKELREILSDAFHRRCCYCETYVDASSGVIEHFRPKGGRAPEDRLRSRGYWYLQADWRNLYWACATCNRYKADRFPLINDPAPYGISYDEIIVWERPVLLDPCLDAPDEHLRFFADGHVEGVTARGWENIKILDLNRPQLLISRKDQGQLFLLSDPRERAEKAIENTAHCAVWRQLLESRLIVGQAPEPVEEQIDTEAGIGLAAYRAKSQYISRIRIKNFGPIHLLDLDLSLSQSPQAPCFALLGENGVGKSTILRALALALSGKSYVERLRLNSGKLLSDGALEGEVRVSIVGGENDVVMKLRRNRSIEFSAAGSRSLVVAYGATRLLPRGRHKPKQGEAYAKIDNLFDPFLPLSNPEKWLSEQDEEKLSEVNEILSSLMPQDNRVSVVKSPEPGKVLLNVGGTAVRKIEHLSDGYQSMLGMAVDVMQVLQRSEAPSLESAEGIVIIDELGNHFHPAWRLQCLTALRRAFPRAQFIYSTHDPLCLRGLYEEEVAVLRRDRLGHIYALEELPPVSRLRVEQLLSSEHFGLRTTADPKMEEDIREYEVLLGTSSRTEIEEARLAELVQSLTDDRYLGATRRERLALQLLDTSGIEDIPAQPGVSAQSLSKETISRLRYIMNQVSPRAGAEGGQLYDQN